MEEMPAARPYLLDPTYHSSQAPDRLLLRSIQPRCNIVEQGPIDLAMSKASSCEDFAADLGGGRQCFST
jgi:hypothetical protein